jgi:hypothetical protein
VVAVVTRTGYTKKDYVLGHAVMRRFQPLFQHLGYPSVRRTIKHWLSPMLSVAAAPGVTTASKDGTKSETSHSKSPWLTPVDDDGNTNTAQRHRPWWWTLPLWPCQSDDWLWLIERLAHKPLVLLPVFNHATSLEQAVQALLCHCSGMEQLILLDDGSTDPAVLLLLQQYKKLPGISVIRHAKRAGLTACWQRGLQLAASRGQDLVLLSCELIVSHRWLQQLKLAAYSQAQIASVSANQHVRLGLPSWLSEAERQQRQVSCARAIAQAGYTEVSRADSVEIGCLYIRFCALAAVLACQSESKVMDVATFLTQSTALGRLHLQSYKAVVWPSFGHQHLYRPLDPFLSPVSRQQGDNDIAAQAISQQQQILQRLCLTTTAEPVVKARKLLLLSGDLPASLLTSISAPVGLSQPAESASADAVEWLLCQCSATEMRLSYCYPSPGQSALFSTLEWIPRLSTSASDAALLQSTLSRWLLQWSVEQIDVSHVSLDPAPELQLLVAVCRQFSLVADLQ